MPRRRRQAKGGKALPMAMELVLGMYGDCKHFGRGGCSKVYLLHLPNEGEGPCPDPYVCLSEYEDREEQEEAYWQHRADLLSARVAARAVSWWWYEADSVCRHEPRCPHAKGHGREGAVAEAEWLAYHDALSVRERTKALRWGDAEAEGIRRGEERRKRERGA